MRLRTTLCTLLLLLLAAGLPAQQTGALFNGQPPAHLVICAHRGRLSGSELENSVTVMRHTFSQGIPMVEFDLQESRDGVIFLSHDTTLDRTTGASGPIATYSSKQLDQVFQLAPGTGKPLEPLARFEDLLVCAQENSIQLMVDLKGAPPADAVSAIRGHHLLGRVVLLTFDEKTTALALAADPRVLVSVLTPSRAQIDAAIIQAKGHPLALYLPGTADSSLFAYARKSGKPVITDVLGAVDDRAASQGPEVYREFIQRHPVDILVTNHPLELQQAVQAGQR